MDYAVPASAGKLIVLLTPQHTGTHFARLLLECHSRISFCLTESRRTNVDRRAGYRLAGNGDGPRGPANERLLDAYVTDYFHGRCSATEFVELVRYAMSQRTERFGERTLYEHVGRVTTSAMLRLGIELPAKEPEYLLFHGHGGPKYRRADLNRGDFSIVVTLRHPLLAVISSLRRTQNPAVAGAILEAFDLVLDIRGAIFLCTDLCRSQPDRLLEVFRRLQLPDEPAARRFAELSPVVNETIPHGETPPTSFQERESVAAPWIAQSTLREAKDQLLRNDGVHPVLQPWYGRMVELKLPERLEPLGYRF